MTRQDGAVALRGSAFGRAIGDGSRRLADRREFAADDAQIVDEAPVLGRLGCGVGQPQQEGRMDGDEARRGRRLKQQTGRARARSVTLRPVSDRAAVAPSATVSCGRSGRARAPATSGRLDLAGVRLLVDAPLAARLEFEMLDRVGDVDAGAVDAGLGKRAVEQLAGRADERPAGEILLIAGLLADEHERRVARALAEHGLGRGLPERAALARRAPAPSAALPARRPPGSIRRHRRLPAARAARA